MDTCNPYPWGCIHSSFFHCLVYAFCFVKHIQHTGRFCFCHLQQDSRIQPSINKGQLLLSFFLAGTASCLTEQADNTIADLFILTLQAYHGNRGEPIEHYLLCGSHFHASDPITASTKRCVYPCALHKFFCLLRICIMLLVTAVLCRIETCADSAQFSFG